ncbi:MAG: PilZ domain-containing protein [Candidatus Acidiferrum sp.]|jgi:c-di-GMP-binding flagellar brake protein YcgR
MTIAEKQVKKAVVAAGCAIERRGFSRHHLIDRIFIGTDDGTFSAVSREISQGGMSAATLGDLTVGQAVSLGPIVGERINAVVRRNQRTAFGFEFIDLPAAISEQIKTLCETLPLSSRR